jgi:hypothetical protein
MIATLVELRLNSGMIHRIATAPFDTILDGVTFLSVGGLLSIDETAETNELNKTGITIQLDGISEDYRSEVVSGGFVKARVDVITVEIPDNTNVASTFAYYHRGYCDTPTITIDYDSGSISLSIETTNAFTDLDLIPNLLRSSVSVHQSRHAGDMFFEFCADTGLEERWID